VPSYSKALLRSYGVNQREAEEPQNIDFTLPDGVRVHVECMSSDFLSWLREKVDGKETEAIASLAMMLSGPGTTAVRYKSPDGPEKYVQLTRRTQEADDSVKLVIRRY